MGQQVAGRRGCTQARVVLGLLLVLPSMRSHAVHADAAEGQRCPYHRAAMTVSTVARRLTGCLLQKPTRLLICCMIGWLGAHVLARRKTQPDQTINRLTAYLRCMFARATPSGSGRTVTARSTSCEQ